MYLKGSILKEVEVQNLGFDCHIVFSFLQLLDILDTYN